MNDKKVACQNCLFFQALFDTTNGTVSSGVCCRYPPKTHTDNTFSRPKVNLSSWCGEFVHVSFKEEVFDFNSYIDDPEDLDELFS